MFRPRIYFIYWEQCCKIENEIKKYTKAKFCVACINGTSALHVSLKSDWSRKNHEVIAPTMSFIATVNSILYIGDLNIYGL